MDKEDVIYIMLYYMYYIHILYVMGYYLTIKNNEILLSVTTWMVLESIMLGEIS